MSFIFSQKGRSTVARAGRTQTTHRFLRFLACIYFMSFLIALALLNTYFRDLHHLIFSLPLPQSVKQWGIYHPEFGSGPLIPRSAFNDLDQLRVYSETIHVLSLPYRHDRRIQMEWLRTYLGLDWTYAEATTPEDDKVKTIMRNVRTLREEAMRSRKLEQEQKQEWAPSSLEPNETSLSQEPSSQSPVVLPFMWPLLSDGREVNISDAIANSSVLALLSNFNVSGERLSIPFTESNSGRVFPAEPTPDTLEDLPMFQEPLVCATEDFTLAPYSSNLRPHRLLTEARVACWHSHLDIISQIAVKDTPVVHDVGESTNGFEDRSGDTDRHIDIILEDDIDMEKDIRARLGHIWRALPTDWDIVFLGHCWSNESFYPAILPSESSSRNLSVISAIHSTPTTLHRSFAPRCTHAYALSSRGARKLLAHLTYPPFAYSRAIDQGFAWLVASGRINAYSVVPSVIVQRRIGKSDVWEPGRVEGSSVESVGSGWRDGLVDGVFGT